MIRTTRTPSRARRSRGAGRALVASLTASLVVAPLGVLAPTAFAEDEKPAGDPAHVPVRADGPGQEHYVAMGDSFVSGPGIPDQREGGCDRSTKNFPSVVAETLDVASFIDASCSGATTTHFWNTQTQRGSTNAPQLDALSEETTLVTFGTMGGNDVGLVQLATSCGLDALPCVPAAGTDPLAAKFAQVRTDLAAALEETQKRAPKAEVMVVGYGTYVPPGGCPASFSDAITADEFDYLQDQIDRLSDLMREVAAEAGAHFVDQRRIPGAGDHTACAEPEDQWIRGFEAYGDGYVLHPSTAGMAATASYVVDQVAEMRDKGEQPSEPAPKPPVTKPTPKPNPGPTAAQQRAARLKALRAKASTVKLSATCRGSRRKGTVTLAVRGGKGAVSAVTFKAGSKKLAVDRKAPWSTKKRSATVRKHLRKRSAKVSATVTLRDGSLTVTRTLKLAKRPACLR